MFGSQVKSAADSGRLVEMFGTGTACMVQPVMGLVKGDGTEVSIPFDSEAAKRWIAKPPGSATSSDDSALSEPFSLCGRLTRALLDIQYGYVDSEWSVVIDP